MDPAKAKLAGPYLLQVMESLHGRWLLVRPGGLLGVPGWVVGLLCPGLVPPGRCFHGAALPYCAPCLGSDTLRQMISSCQSQEEKNKV